MTQHHIIKKTTTHHKEITGTLQQHIIKTQEHDTTSYHKEYNGTEQDIIKKAMAHCNIASLN